MENNYLIIPNDKKDLSNLKGCKVLYPFKSFSVGFNYYFELNEIIEDNAYLYVNRLLSSVELDNLSEIIKKLPTNILGIVFEDLGMYEIIKDLKVEKIFYSSHILTNYSSINQYLNYFDSCVISPDLSIKEINTILDNSNKNLCLYGFGHMPLSYSRRTLNTNYAKNYNIDSKSILEIKNTDFEFLSVENEYGTITYDKEVFSCLEENYTKEVKYFIINLFNIGVDKFLSKEINTTRGFLDNETFYKLKEKKND